MVAQHRDICDPDTGGQLTVKIYESQKVKTADGSWRHQSIVLKPDSTFAEYEPILLRSEQAETLRIIAVLIAVLG